MIIARINDVQIKNKIVLASGILIIKDQEFKFLSGGWGNGPIPLGIYNLQRPYVVPQTHPSYVAMKRDGNAWFSALIPLFKTDRTGLGIHPDGNLPGSLGCIALIEKDLVAQVLLSQIGNDEQLKVI